jgi:DNA-binding response OmpR family regulator
MIIAVIDDLLFSSRIRAVAQKAGADVTFARNRDAAVAAARGAIVDLIIVDLEGRAGDAIETIRSFRAEGSRQPRIVGFGSHVNVELLKAARDAGCDQAMARSAFVAALPGLLTPPRPGAQ